jgi:hypothetical protein
MHSCGTVALYFSAIAATLVAQDLAVRDRDVGLDEDVPALAVVDELAGGDACVHERIWFRCGTALPGRRIAWRGRPRHHRRGHITRDLEQVGAENLAGKVLLGPALLPDVTDGFPPALTVANTDSLGEQIQRNYPGTRGS